MFEELDDDDDYDGLLPVIDTFLNSLHGNFNLSSVRGNALFSDFN